MRATLARAAVLGAVAGCLEFLIRCEPRFGFGFFDQLTWLTLACAAGLAVALPFGVLAHLVRGHKRIGPRRDGLVLGALLGMHGALHYRFDIALNQSLRDPDVWGVLLLMFVCGVLIGLSMARLLTRVGEFLPWVGFILAFIGLLRSVPPAPTATPGPSILLVTWDTTRPDRLGPYGGPASTPNLDRMAAEGAVFESVVATAPLTEASHLSILTGLPTVEHGVVSNGTPLGERPELLSHRLQDAGYRTGAVVSGFPLHGKWGWTQGFDVYDDDFGRLPGWHRLSLARAIDEVFLPGNALRERDGAVAVHRAKRFLERHEGGQFFLWVHLFDPHAPYEALDADDAPRVGEALDLPAYWPPYHRGITSTDWLVDAYDAELEKTDALFGELLDALDDSGLADSTTVVMVADHGESLTEHGVLFDHGDDLYDPSLLVPLLIREPGVGATRVACQVSTIDIVPTLRALHGLPVGSEQGRSLVPMLEGEACADVPAIASTIAARHVEEPPVDFAWRLPETKYIRHGDMSRPEELYDLTSDPGELFVVEDDEALTHASDRLDALLAGRDLEVDIQLDEADRLMLESLGYLE